MKIVVQVKLLATPEAAEALHATLPAVNAAANHASAVAYARFGLQARQYDLHHAVYAELKGRGLGAQAAIRVIKRVVDAYTTLRASINAGNLGPKGSPRRIKSESKPITFRTDAAHSYDDRCLSWQHDARTVSIWTVRGRIKSLAFTGSPAQLKTLAEHRKGESDLVCRDGKWFLVATCEIPARGIALEELSGIRDRGRLTGDQRATLSAWPFHQLQQHIRYKARRAGVPVVTVDPAYTSQTCPQCGHVSRKNRPCRDRFLCRRCGLAGLADHVAAVNVRDRARRAWVFVNTPVPQGTEHLPFAGRCDPSPPHRRGQSGSATRLAGPEPHKLGPSGPRS